MSLLFGASASDVTMLVKMPSIVGPRRLRHKPPHVPNEQRYGKALDEYIVVHHPFVPKDRADQKYSNDAPRLVGTDQTFHFGDNKDNTSSSRRYNAFEAPRERLP